MASTVTTSKLDQLAAGTWNVDVSHSNVSFTARHLMITKVRGRFTSFTGSVTIADDKLQSSVTATVDMGSVSTGDTGRDAHIVGADFFDAETFPTMTFVSTGIEPAGSDYVLKGDLTIKGVTKPVQFDLEFDGASTDPWGNFKSGFTAETEINRKDWGLEWNMALETGGVVVSEKIKIQLDIQLAKEA